MDVDIKPGTYVVAVSGGVDSMVLLDVLAKNPDVKLTVAHFDHGIRVDSKQDRELVQKTAKNYKLPFVYHEGKLGPGTSEALARTARYAFLRRVQQAANAQAVITAHHQDDVLETAILNVLRGTGRKGLTSLQNHQGLVRPLLRTPKQALIDYALANGLTWHEDSTNQDTAYKRNHIRRNLIPRFTSSEKQTVLSELNELAKINADLDRLLMNHLHMQPAHDVLDRHWFIMLPHNASLELMATWLRQHNIRGFDSKLLERLTVAGKVLPAGKKVDIDSNHHLIIEKTKLALVVRTDGRLSQK